MKVGRTHCNGLPEHLVDERHDRSIVLSVAAAQGRLISRLILNRGCLLVEGFHQLVAAQVLSKHLVIRLGQCLDRLLQLELINEKRLRGIAVGKAEILERLSSCRI